MNECYFPAIIYHDNEKFYYHDYDNIITVIITLLNYHTALVHTLGIMDCT